MLKILKNKKAQNTAEYAILIALVIGAVVAMQTYSQRSLQARLRDTSVYMKDQTPEFGDVLQYEPYYQTSESESERFSNDTFDKDGSSTNSVVKTTESEETTLAPSVSDQE